MNYVILSLLLLFCISTSQSRTTNLCSEVPGCRCKENSSSSKKGTFRADCSGTNLFLEGLVAKNISTLVIKKSRFSNVSFLSSLRDITALKSFTIRETEIPYFDWNWLPDNCTKVAISHSSYRKQKYKPVVFRDANGSCLIRPTLNVTSLYVTSVLYEDVPSCLPSTLATVAFFRTPLNGFGSNSTVPIRWPSKMKLLNLKSFDFTAISERVFRNISVNLKRIIINDCKKHIYTFPSSWPKQTSLTSLYFKNCRTNKTSPSDFEHLQQLRLLDLGGNRLVRIPDGLPKGLETLNLERNSIDFVGETVLNHLSNLTKLNMNGNKLLFVPSNLPANLKQVYFSENAIRYVDERMFTHLTNLNVLDISGNRIFNMPENLPTTLRILVISGNPISQIRSPSNYDYCGNNCTIVAIGIKWVCDLNLIHMLSWIHQNAAKMIFDNSEQCTKTIRTGDETILTEVTRYFDYLKNSEEFGRCKYGVTKLSCANISLSKLPKQAPNELQNVTVIYNPNLTATPDHYFTNQTKLKYLDMSYNAITQFPKGLPPSLEKLRLEGNRIETIAEDIQPTLNNLTNLLELHLMSNRIKIMYDFQLLPMVNLKWVSLHHNPLHCTCSMYSLTVWFMDHIETSKLSRYFLPTCATPSGQMGKSVDTLLPYFKYKLKCNPTICEWRLPIAPSGVLNCSRSMQMKKQSPSVNNFVTDSFDPTKQPNIPRNSYWKVLDLSNLELHEDEIRLKQLPRLHTLNLTGNKMRAIPSQELPWSLENLILARNNIEGISSRLFQRLPNLKYLDLSRNKIKMLTNDALASLPVINQVLLQSNPFACNCDLRPLVNYIQAQKDNSEELQRNRFSNLTCESPERLKHKALLHLPEDDYCVVEAWTTVTGGVLGGISFLLLIAVVAIVVLYKKRKQREKKDIVKAFRQLLEEDELNDEENEQEDAHLYQFDAFVSYCSNTTDEDFVYKMLEVLEDGRGRKLCIHERDFIPGRGIADNIVNCISHSRRIILILSKKYITSSWCQYEVQVALAQMHQHRRGRLLLPVLLEDVTKDEECAGSVKTILSLISGLHTPSIERPHESWEGFWDSIDKAITAEQNFSVPSSSTYDVE